MQRRELDDFYNEGFGWICRCCEQDLKQEAAQNSDWQKSRLMSEGEAESKQPPLSSHALAKWADEEQKTLVCPRCGITETVDKSKKN